MADAAYKLHLANYWGLATGQYFATNETIDTPSDHVHAIRKYLDFTHVP